VGQVVDKHPSIKLDLSKVATVYKVGNVATITALDPCAFDPSLEFGVFDLEQAAWGN
jgi:hypothetical protein